MEAERFTGRNYDISVKGNLTSGDIKRLARQHKTIRDPVHGDVILNRLEVSVIDTPLFQRLRGHKQLGLSDRVYPGGEHSRFQHAIGTLFVASLMIDNVNRNANLYPNPAPFKIDEYGTLVTRLAALVHDLVNIPFGHTIEDEGILIPKDWKDSDRVDALFDEDDENSLFHTVTDGILGLDDSEEADDDAPSITQRRDEASEKAQQADAEDKARTILEDVRKILTFEDNGDKDFEYAYAADIVGNTFCADLLDYLERDAYFTGAQSKFRTDRSRAISYLFIPREGPAKKRLVVRLWHHNRFKDDVVSELFNVLRARTDLAETVYFHHAKVSLSAMLIAAVQRAKLIDRTNKSELLRLSDQDVFDKLKASDDEAARSLVSDIESRRRLYAPVYLVSNLDTVRRGKSIKFTTAVDKMRDSKSGAKSRLEYENTLAQRCHLKSGQVVIHCPDTEMNLKAARTRVLWEQESVEGIAVLADIKDDDIEGRLNMLRKEHEALWKFHVLVDRRVGKERRKLLAAACWDIFGRDNEVTQYKECKNALEMSLRQWSREENVLPDESEHILKALNGDLPMETRAAEITSLIDKIQRGPLPTPEDFRKIGSFLSTVLPKNKR